MITAFLFTGGLACFMQFKLTIIGQGC